MYLMQLDLETIVVATLPTVLVFVTGSIFPMSPDVYSPAIQPPGWMFGVVWFYLTVAFGVVSAIALKHKTVRGIPSRQVVQGLYASILSGLVAWLPIFYHKHYAASLGVILVLSVLSVIYVMWLSYIRCGGATALIPLCAWLTVAACLNSVIYEVASRP